MSCNKKLHITCVQFLWRPEIQILVCNQNKHEAMASEHISADFSVASLQRIKSTIFCMVYKFIFVHLTDSWFTRLVTDFAVCKPKTGLLNRNKPTHHTQNFVFNSTG